MLRREGRLPLYLTQAAILEFEAHLRESSLPLPFGLLAGDVCVCPQTKLEYLLVDTVSRARVELGGDDPYAQLAEELQSLASEQSGKRKAPIGWYLGGLADDLTLDDDVTRLHEQLFPERWQLALVRGAASGAERGAFLRYESIWHRWYSIPFFEFLPEHAGQKKGERRTAIRWENYRANEPARPLEASEARVRGVDAAPRPSWGARLFGASPEPLSSAERSTPRVTAPIERKPTAPVEPSVMAPVEQVRAAPVEEPGPEMQHIFIDGALVPAPLASALSQKPGVSPGSDRVSKSSVVVGALLFLIPVLLYLVVR
jgi:hypothetical protein